MRIFSKYHEEILVLLFFLSGTLVWMYKSDNFFYKSHCDFEMEAANWNCGKSSLSGEKYYSGKFSQKFNPQDEFGCVFSSEVNKMVNASDEVVVASVYAFLPDRDADPQIVVSVEKRDSSLLWLSSGFSKSSPVAGEWSKISITAQLPEMNIKEKEVVLKAYVWNNNKDSFFIDDFEIKVRPAP